METIPCSHGAHDVNYCVSCLRALLAEVTGERDAALDRCEKLRNLADAAASEQGLAQRRMMEAQKQRDEARAYAEERNDEANNLQRYLNMAAQERDEARQELDFIKAEYGGEDDELLTMDALIIKLRLALAGAENSIAANVEHEKRLLVESSELAQEAYRRGAEAMREALANVVRVCRLNCTRESNCEVCAKALSALPKEYEI